MSDLSVSMEENPTLVQSNPLEGLISTYFDRTFLVLNTFMEDPRTCLELNEDIYRAVDETGDISEHAVFEALVHRVRGLSTDLGSLKGLQSDNVLCWLLKESSELNYNDISEMMSMDRREVKEAIAKVRWHLLD